VKNVVITLEATFRRALANGLALIKIEFRFKADIIIFAADKAARVSGNFFRDNN
jgi:hypothetical protein